MRFGLLLSGLLIVGIGASSQEDTLGLMEIKPIDRRIDIEKVIEGMNIHVMALKLDPQYDDESGFYAVGSLLRFRQQLLSKKVEVFDFSRDMKIFIRGNLAIAEYLVISRFMVEDIRLERVVMVFNNDIAKIVFISPRIKESDLKKMLIEKKYVVNRNGEYIWDYINKRDNEFVLLLRNGTIDIPFLKEWYTRSSKIVDSIIR
jgi:hypothetical protein